MAKQPENLQDGQTMPGFDGPEEGSQDSYLTPPPTEAPPRYISPPSDSQFDNATRLKASADIVGMIGGMIQDWEEFSDIRGEDFITLWRRAMKPTRLMEDGEKEPIFASVEIVDPMTLWIAQHEYEISNWPRFIVNLHWQHFEDLRSDESGAQWVHEDVMLQHVHHALSSLRIHNDRVQRRPATFSGYPATVKRYGAWTSGARAFLGQLRFWEDRADRSPE